MTKEKDQIDFVPSFYFQFFFILSYFLCYYSFLFGLRFLKNSSFGKHTRINIMMWMSKVRWMSTKKRKTTIKDDKKKIVFLFTPGVNVERNKKTTTTTTTTITITVTIVFEHWCASRHRNFGSSFFLRKKYILISRI